MSMLGYGLASTRNKEATMSAKMKTIFAILVNFDFTSNDELMKVEHLQWDFIGFLFCQRQSRAALFLFFPVHRWKLPVWLILLMSFGSSYKLVNGNSQCNFNNANNRVCLICRSFLSSNRFPFLARKLFVEAAGKFQFSFLSAFAWIF